MRMSNKIARDVLWLGHTKKKKNTEETDKYVKYEQSENAARLVVVSVAFEKAKMVRTSRQSHINKLMHDTN